jgi:hypothetical protein
MPTILSPKGTLLGYRHGRLYPPQADTKTAIKELHWTLCKLEIIYPEAAFIVAGDFYKANMRTRLTKIYQHVDCST